jgi:hypothetical protein
MEGLGQTIWMIPLWPFFLALSIHLADTYRLRQRKSRDRHSCIMSVALHEAQDGGEWCWDEMVRR